MTSLIFQAVTAEELRRIEQEVNEKFGKRLTLKLLETDIDTAKEMDAMALFGEKYGKEVRVVTIGDYSIELCGGTHMKILLKVVFSRLSKKKESAQEHVAFSL